MTAVNPRLDEKSARELASNLPLPDLPEDLEITQEPPAERANLQKLKKL